MKRALSEAGIVRSLAEQACQRVARKTISTLQSMDSALLAGDNSGLTSTWDELCVQLQGELSIFWDQYEQVVRDLVQREIQTLPAYEIDAIWLQTPSGEHWSCEEEDARDPDPVIDDEVTEYILKDVVFERASDWSNRRIRNYLEQAV